MKQLDVYHGFEQGPIRPPSEAHSLLIRATRNCPWNRCSFCPVYKGSRFSIRQVDHVKRDIDSVHKYVEILQQTIGDSGRIGRPEISKIAKKTEQKERSALMAAFNWLDGSAGSVFIQDANSLIARPSGLMEILTHIKKRFPWVERITSYARSHTVARIKERELKAIRDAGLNRIHIGLESGSNQVLKMVNKGATKELHIEAAFKIKKAGIELSEYIMPGLGGREYSDIHALETADALNRINPNFIRLRTLAIPDSVPLFEDCRAGRFKKCTDLMIAKEILMFIERLDGITSVIKSDHTLNLFEDVDGALSGEKRDITRALRLFITMDSEQRCLYQVGKRLGIFSCLNDMENRCRLTKVKKICCKLGITPENVDKMVDELIKRFI